MPSSQSSAAAPTRFDAGNLAAERNTQRVLILTTIMMVIEIIGGYVFNSMALLADGWHMTSHVLAIGLNTLAYIAARRLAHDRRYAFGTWKIEVLAGFASAMILFMVALSMVWESALRMWHPAAITYPASLLIASLGLLVNVASAWLLGHGHLAAHTPGHATHAHDHDHSHDDLNLRSAYLHVLADAATSILALVALGAGWHWGWNWMDAAVGILGGGVVAVWAIGLMRQTAQILLDREMDHPLVARVRHSLRTAPDWGAHTELADLRMWRVGRRGWACLLSLVTTAPHLNARTVQAQLATHPELMHVTVEVHHLPQATSPTQH